MSHHTLNRAKTNVDFIDKNFEAVSKHFKVLLKETKQISGNKVFNELLRPTVDESLKMLAAATWTK